MKKLLGMGWAMAVALTLAAPAAAQMPGFDRIPAPAAPAPEIPLYPAAGKQGAQSEIWNRFDGHPVLRNVTQPTITPFLPAPDKATGAAVVVLPGGGFTILAMEAEGWSIGQWFADHGIAAFVLKYRLAPTPVDEKALPEFFKKYMGADIEKVVGAYIPPAVEDATSALKLVRAGATTWRIDPARVGVIGFSAGAMASRGVVLSPDAAARPAFFGYIYGPMDTVTVPADAPPMFAALAMDDPLFGGRGFGIVDAWHKAGRPVELHAYEKGGHGFGAGKPGTTTTQLLPEFVAWLEARGLLGKH
ncbi:esterase [Sphingomonas sp. HMWF008]|nr:esterase [Sphingomonas sp. HMWF008]